MEAETTDNIVEAVREVPNDDSETNDFLQLLSKCGSCREDLINRNPKLLSCLHSFCMQCVGSFETGESGHITCPVCRQVSLISNVIDNMFLPEHPTGANGLSDGRLSASHVCTGCDENVSASHYCNECTEWLCEPCAQAHRRVKVTKDHSVETVDRVPSIASGATSAQQQGAQRRRALMCALHPQEQLKLYCDTCAKLTCRDCQLVEHKDHKYQFVQEAASSYKDLLQLLLGKVKEKQAHIHNARNLIDRRNKEITEKEKVVGNEVKTFVMSLIREVNLKGRQLIGDLQAICGAKRRQLDQKSTEVRLLSDNLQHGLRFAEFLLTNVDDAALLYSRRTLANQLSAILRTRCEVPNPYHVVDLRFVGNQTVSTALSKLGCIVVDGYQYGSRTNQSGGSAPIVPSNASTLATNKQPASDNKLQMAMQMRLGHHGSQPQQQLAGHGPGMVAMGGSKQYCPPDYYSNGSMGHRMSHMPHQSSNISSSNQHQTLTSGGYMLPQGGRSSAPLSLASTGYMSHAANQPYRLQSGAITLTQLQEERIRRERKEMVSTSLQPIVIQPTDCISDSPYTSGNVKYPLTPCEDSQDRYNITFNTPNDAISNSSASKGETSGGNALLCGLLTDIKTERKSIECDQQPKIIGSISLVRSRTPTPRIESTNQDLVSGDSPVSEATGNGGGIDQVIIGDQFSLADFHSIGNGEEMFATGVDSKSDDWSAAKESSASDVLVLDMPAETSLEPGTEMVSQSSRATDDRNDDYCAVCRNGGDLLCCDRCPRVYHLKCHVPVLNSSPNPNATWLCTLCSSTDDKLRLENTRNVDPADIRITAGSKRRSANCGLSDKEHQTCERLLLELYAHESSIPFHEPVSKSVPNYHKIIANPMDFGTIRCRLNKQNFNHYQTVEEFISDVKLVCRNCAIFNLPTTAVGRCGIAVEEYFDERLQQLMPFVDIRSNSTPGSEKSEGSRSTGRSSKRRKLSGSRSVCDEDPVNEVDKEHLEETSLTSSN